MASIGGLRTYSIPGDDRITSLRRQFAVLDTDEDGKISTEQLTNVLRSIDLNITDKEMAEFARRTDRDGDGVITFEDFVHSLDNMKIDGPSIAGFDQEVVLRQTFEIFDRQRLGSIGPKDIWTVLKNLGKDFSLEDIEEMVEEVDDNGDSRITYAEFVQMVISE